MSKSASVFQLTLDKALGAAGGGLAAASLGFGIYMNVHGPVASFGTSKDFTVFAQLAPKPQPAEQTHANPATASDPALDMTATASIPKTAPPVPTPAAVPDDEDDRLDADTNVIASMTLETVDSDAATISIDGRAQTVRIGDMVPGAGEVLEIRPGRHARIRTSRGLILGARQ